VLAEAIPAIVRGLPGPSRSAGAPPRCTESLRWVRPLQGIVALLDGAVVACEVGGIVAGRETMGHRFHSLGAIAIESADTYADQLRAAHVLVDHEERQGSCAPAPPRPPPLPA
jgi:glycyl-tRNA synthetase beta chain